MKRGYFGIGIYRGKTKENIGTLWRSAHNFGADFIFTIGFRATRQASDTTKAERHVPLYEYDSWEDFKKNIPVGSKIVFVEQSDKSKPLATFNHPERCLYILGAEDKGIPENMMNGKQVINISTPMCLNVAVAGSIVMYDRQVKQRTQYALLPTDREEEKCIYCNTPRPKMTTYGLGIFEKLEKLTKK